MEQNLRVPGPTPLPRAVRHAQAGPMINHRGPEFAELLRETTSGVGRLIGTRGEVFLLTGSGTGALEAAVVNTLSPGDRVLGVSIGAFGDRFARIAEIFGAEVERLDFEWGAAADPDRLAAHLAGAERYRAVLLTHNETSTGVTNPLRELVATVRAAPGESLVLVDGISGLGALPFEMDEWGVDLVVGASQKAFMASPGIAIAAVGARARAAEAEARMPRFYWDLGEARRWAEQGQTPWTPAVSVLYGLRVGVANLEAEGREQTWARHAAVAAGAAAGLEALGFTLVAAPEHRSATVTAAWLPDGLDWGEFGAALRSLGLVLAGGQGKWTGQILRIGHMGDVAWGEIDAALAVMAEALQAVGRPADPAAARDAGRAAHEARAGVGVV
ncbi:MAG: alanine--glyoxylate aminotransferase family protein [Chloroflexota bacterium]